MKKRSVYVVSCIIVIMVLASIGFVSAGVFFENIQSTYNLGDIIDVNIGVEPVREGHLIEVDLVCEGVDVIKFNEFPDEEGKSNIKLPLNFFTIKEASGDCLFRARHGNEIRESKGFQISKRLNVVLSTEAFYANPGDEIVVRGSAKRLNGELVNGQVEVSIPLLSLYSASKEVEETEEIVEKTEESNKSEEESEEVVEEEESAEESEEVGNETESEEKTTEEVVEEINIDAGKFYGKVENGEFLVSINLADDTPAGDYRIDVSVYEEMGGIKTSEEIVMGNLKVFQVLTSVDIALSNQNTDPGLDYSFRPRLLDQTGLVIPEEISVIIRDLEGKRVYEKIVQSDETVNFLVPGYLTSGYYEIEASSGEVSGLKKFYVNEKAIASFELVNGTLIVTNVGNIPYKKDIEIELNGKPFVKSVDLELGESQEFKLTGSGEEYNIKVSDGDSEVSQGGVTLTGRAVGVEEVGKGISLGLKTPLVWIFLILILGAGILFLFRNVFKGKSFAYPWKKKERKTIEKKDVEASTHAEQVMVLQGNKSKAVVVVLKIKNKINENAKKSLEKSIENVYDKKGAIYEQGDYIYIIFSPIMTKTDNNEIKAVRCAEKIVLFLKEHNKKFKDKIEFGVGINSGEVINKVENKKLKFTALGNFISAAKRLADSSDEQILVSKASYEGRIDSVKAEKREVAGGDVYEVKKVINHDQHKEFIRKFLEREGKEK